MARLLSIVALGMVLWTANIRPAGSQDVRELVFDTYSTADGLPFYMVTALLQDRMGFLWVGTFDGLARFDGERFRVYSAETGALPHPYVKIGGLYEDREGRLWIGTEGGLAMRSPSTGKFRHWTHTPGDATTLSHNNVTGITQGPGGRIWVATLAGVNQINPETGEVRRLSRNSTPAVPEGYVSAVAVDHRGRLWVGTGLGVYTVDLSTGETRRPEQALPALRGIVRSLYVAPDGTVWIGFQDGRLSGVDPVTDEAAVKAEVGGTAGGSLGGWIWAILEDAEGVVWVGTRARGLGRYLPESGIIELNDGRQSTEDGLANPQVTALLEDGSRNLWVGTWDGLNMVRRRHPFHHLPLGSGDRLQVSTIVPAASDGDEYWVGTFDHGLLRVSVRAHAGRPTSSVLAWYRQGAQSVGGLGDDRISSVAPAGDQGVWVATARDGLSSLDEPNRTFTKSLPGSEATSLFEPSLTYRVVDTRAGEIWLATNQGLIRRERASGTEVFYRAEPGRTGGLTASTVYTLLEDSKGRMWVGTLGGGLLRYQAENEEFIRIGVEGGLEGRVLSLQEADNGTIWIGTLGRGVFSFDPGTSVLRNWTAGDGLPSNHAGCVLPAGDGVVWIASPAGLARLDPVTGQVATFGMRDGLPNQNFQDEACTEGPDGVLLFGTDSGLVAFRSADVRIPPTKPSVAITEMRVLDRAVNLDSLMSSPGVMTLSYTENFLRFGFSALDYTAPERNRYLVRLQGEDADWWAPEGVQAVSYPRLAPGDYVFAVRAANPFGEWSETTASIAFRITPPFWKTWWYYSALGGLIVLIGYLAHQYRVRELLRMERTRQRIADDLHDEVGSRLGGLALALDVAAHTGDSHTQELAARADDARDLLGDLRDTVWVVDGSAGTLQDLSDRIRLAAESLFPANQVEVTVSSEGHIQLDMEVRRHLLFIAKEALHNVHRHAAATRVRIVVDGVSSGDLSMTIEDNGIGFRTTSSAGRGLASMKRRGEAVGAELAITSTPGTGTRVSVRVRRKMARSRLGFRPERR